MRRAIPTSLLILTLLLQGWSSVLAAVSPSVFQTQAKVVEVKVAVMPCHGTQDRDSHWEAMDCCDADGACLCAAHCLSAVHAVLHASSSLDAIPKLLEHVVLPTPALRPPDSQGPYRPPSSHS